MAAFITILLVAILIFAVVVAAVLGVGIGICYTIRWKWPNIDFGMAFLIGVVTAGLAIHYFLRILSLLELWPTRVDSKTLRDYEDDDDDDDEPPLVYVQPPQRGRRRRRRGQ